jgi:deoxynucleoside triphosphate triphosphohydrolase SAMHD1
VARRPLRDGLPKALGAVSADFQESLGPALDAYISNLRHFKKIEGPKVINDPVWRTVRVEQWELAVLDCPLVQRLRNIHQLGLAGFVFPGGGYSRFEHTVGVLHQTQRLIEAVRRNAKAYAAKVNVPPDAVVSPGEEIALRLSALLHDCGHGFFSHVSERAIARIELLAGFPIRDLKEEAKDYFGCPSTPAPAEIFSCLLVLLPEFVDILELARVPGWQTDPSALADTIAKYIAGGRDARKPFLSEMISGALDADKLDYMPRDSYMAGLPMPVDVDRLLEKIQAVSVMAGRLGFDYAKRFNLAEDSTVQILAVQLSGARAFEELVVSRSLLYEKLYNHQKVRAIEGMIENALDLLIASSDQFSRASTFLRFTDADVLSKHLPPCKDGQTVKYTAACDLIDAVASRQIFVRAFAFGPSLITLRKPNDPADEELARTGWEQIKPLVTRRRTKEALAFRNDIANLSRDFLNVAGQAGLAGELEEHHLIVDLPDAQGIAEKTRFYVGDQEQGVELYSQRFRVERWAEAYENQKALGYVYCPPRFRAAVFLACRQLFKERGGLDFGTHSWGMTKVSPSEVASLSRVLLERGVLKDPFELPAYVEQRKEFLQSITHKKELLGQFAKDIAALAQRFQTFQAAGGETVNELLIREWLLQFEFEEVPLAVELLRNIKYWDRLALTDAFAVAVEDASIRQGQWVPLGGPTTSARHLTYLWPDIRKRGEIDSSIIVLNDVSEVTEGVPIIFYDDNVGSGGQGRTVLQQWFGVPNDEWIVNEEHVSALKPEAVSKLKRCPIRFLFATGRRQGLQALVSHAKQLVGTDDVTGNIAAPADLSCFRPSGRVFVDRDSADRAAKAFETAGRKALYDRIGVWDDAKIADRRLGYGNAGGLTVFHYNVPTTSVTALWKRCTVEGHYWMPLFPRRPRE